MFTLAFFCSCVIFYIFFYFRWDRKHKERVIGGWKKKRESVRKEVWGYKVDKYEEEVGDEDDREYIGGELTS